MLIGISLFLMDSRLALSGASKSREILLVRLLRQKPAVIKARKVGSAMV